MKRLKGISLMSACIILIILCFVFRTWLISGFGSLINSFLFFDSSPTPLVTYGEFPICIKYEINDKPMILEDVVICEFDGFNIVGLNEKRRNWKTYLKSGNERLTLLKTETVEIYCWHGSATYYMDDLQYQTRGEYEAFFEEYLSLEDFSAEEKSVRIISYEDAEKLYNVKIDSIVYSKPIENTFNE